jgi:CRP-like cAMP-binding protein
MGDTIGQVVDMTWRATCIRTKTQDHVVIPNGEIAKAVIVNYSRPAQLHIVVSKIGLTYDAPPAKVRQVILQVLAEVPEVVRTPPPRVECSEFGDSTIDYLVKYGITDFEQLTTIESRVNDLLWYRFKREDLVIPFPIRTVHLQSVTPEAERARAAQCQMARHALLGRVALFAALTEAERTRLAAEAQEQTFTVNEALVREGEEGSTFFVILSGRVRITVAGPQGEVPLAELGPGDFFGEMSLLTGEKRKATVTAAADTTVLVLAHTALAPLMAGNRGLADQFAEALEKRLADLGSRTREASEAAARQTPVSRGMLVDRIRRFFGV